MHHNKIASLRKSWALTQDDLAQLLGMSRSNVSRAELSKKGEGLETAFILQALFGESIGAIFPLHQRSAYDVLVQRLAVFSQDVEGDDRPGMERKRQLLAQFVDRASDDAAV